jgi:predicted AlkP superfamily phosphohydrolase/phosphomutase
VLGELLAFVPSDALVMLASDHGFRADPEDGDGDHRAEGIWLAKGPMVPSGSGDLEMSATDFVPTLLHCVGAPQAEDFGGRARLEVCPGVPVPAPIATYNGSPATLERGESVIDASREEQLRSLGYID